MSICNQHNIVDFTPDECSAANQMMVLAMDVWIKDTALVITSLAV
jgi:hypothetical protein